MILLLAIFYYIVLTPFSLIYRIFRDDRLLLKRIRRKSYFAVREHTYTPADLEKM